MCLLSRPVPSRPLPPRPVPPRAVPRPSYGHKVMKTIGEDITPLTPTKAYTVNLAAAITVLFCTLQVLTH